jgi:hypothetical protein
VSARRFWYSLGAITFVGFVVRVVYIWHWRRDITPAIVAGTNDAAWYHQASKLLADGRGFISPFFSAPGRGYQSADHPPVYLLFLASFAKLGLDSATQQLLLTATLIGTPTVWLAGLAGRAMRSERVGLIAAALVALSPNVFSWDGMLYSESSAIFAVTLTMWVGYRYWRQPSLRGALFVGAAASLAAMSRAELVLLLPLMAVPLVWRHGERGRQSVIHRIGAVALAATVIIGPWVVYNLTRFEDPVYLSVGAEITMASATCDETYYGEFLGFWWQPCAKAIRDDINRRYPPIEVVADGITYHVPRLDQSEEAPFFGDAATDYIKDHLSRVPAVVLARYGRVLYVFRPEKVVRDDNYFEGRDLWVAQSGRWTFYVLAIFGVIGAYAMRKLRIPRYPLAAAFVTVLAAVTLAFGNPRYRAASETVLCLFAAMGIAWCWDRVSGADPPEASESSPVA